MTTYEKIEKAIEYISQPSELVDILCEISEAE
jgi:hypothetical protein